MELAVGSAEQHFGHHVLRDDLEVHVRLNRCLISHLDLVGRNVVLLDFVVFGARVLQLSLDYFSKAKR